MRTIIWEGKMLYFHEKNNKFYLKVKGSTMSSPTFMRILPAIIPIIVVAVYLYQNNQSKMQFSNVLPVAGMISIFVVANLITHILKSKGLGAGIVIDQMERTISFKKPGGRRNVLNYDTVRNIKLETKNNVAAVIKLDTLDTEEFFLFATRDVQMARQLADELSTLISATVSETVLG